MDILEEIKNKIVKEAKNKLDIINAPEKERKNDGYRDLLESLSAGKCRICKAPLEVVYAEENPDSFRYKFLCGHGWNGITVRETIKIRESIKIKKKQHGIGGFVLETIQGWFSSHRVDLSPEGVIKIRIIDRENNYYKEEVIDEKTGRVIRFIEEKLSEHKK